MLSKKIYKFITLLLALMLLGMPALAAAKEITLMWDPSPDETVIGYRVYMREAGEDYDFDEPEKEVTDNEATIRGLDENKTYFFVVRAFDADDNEGEVSQEVFVTPHSDYHQPDPGGRGGGDR
jgi:chitinase